MLTPRPTEVIMIKTQILIMLGRMLIMETRKKLRFQPQVSIEEMMRNLMPIIIITWTLTPLNGLQRTLTKIN